MSFSTRYGLLLVTLPLLCIFDCVLASNGKNKKRNYFLEIPKERKKKDTAVQTKAKINSSFHSCLQLAVNLYIIP